MNASFAGFFRSRRLGRASSSSFGLASLREGSERVIPVASWFRKVSVRLVSLASLSTPRQAAFPARFRPSLPASSFPSSAATMSNKRKLNVVESDADAKSPPKKNKPDAAAAPSQSTANSFFAPRSQKVAAAKKEAEEAAKALQEEDDGEAAGSSAAASDAGRDGEEDDAAVSEEEDEAAEKLAEIFTRKPADAAAGSGEWKAGEPVPYAALTATFAKIEATTKRLEISAYLTQFLLQVIRKTPDDLVRTVYLCINRLCPDYEGLELGIGESLLMKAIGLSVGKDLNAVKADLKRIGDLGEVAQSGKKSQTTLGGFFKPKALTVNQVFNELRKIAKSSGKDSQKTKVDLINKMLAACVGTESKYLIRSLEGKLRIGLAERTVVLSLAHAFVQHEVEKSGKRLSKNEMASRLEHGSDVVKAVFSEIPSYDLVVPALLKGGIDNLKEACHLTPGIPLKPMLAKPTKAISEVLDRFEGKRFTCEYKYDGERAQVHYLEDGSIKVFSRNSEDMSLKYPDLVEQLPRCIKEGTKSFVIDCEAVAWDRIEKRLLPFQDLSRRKRKDVKAEDVTVKVCLFAFDMLYLDGTPMLDLNLEKRRAKLRDAFVEVEGEFAFATSEDASSVEDIQAFLDKSVKEGCEGLMVKMLEGEGSSYEPSRRSMHWLKLKKDYLAGVGDSFDLVVIGGDYGRGKRTNVYGAFHLACWDADSSTYQTVCKIGTGFSDEALAKFYAELSPLELETRKGYYDVGTTTTTGGGNAAKGPDVYFEPKVVWEVLAADLSKSPIYTAAKHLTGDRGISLRFPRFIRVRDDKSPEESTDPEQIFEAYERQATAANKGGKGKRANADDDFW